MFGNVSLLWQLLRLGLLHDSGRNSSENITHIAMAFDERVSQNPDLVNIWNASESG